MGDADGYDISESDRINIAKEFLRYAPPGEFSQVYKDVSVLLNQNVDNNEEIQACALDYHEDQLSTVVLAEDGPPVLISAQARQEGTNRYYDPKTDTTFLYNPITQQGSDIQQAGSSFRPVKAEPLRLAIEEAIEKYCSQHYPQGSFAVHTQIDSDSSATSTEYIILIEDHEFQPQNRWNGKWRSEWMVSVSSDNTIQLQGGTKVHVHYYEDSNVQLVTKRMFDQVKLDDIGTKPEAIAAGIVKHIHKSENKYQQALRDNYVTMNDTTFKALRRALPIHRAKFNWEQVSQFRVGKEIEARDSNTR